MLFRHGEIWWGPQTPVWPGERPQTASGHALEQVTNKNSLDPACSQTKLALIKLAETTSTCGFSHGGCLRFELPMAYFGVFSNSLHQLCENVTDKSVYFTCMVILLLWIAVRHDFNPVPGFRCLWGLTDNTCLTVLCYFQLQGNLKLQSKIIKSGMFL